MTPVAHLSESYNNPVVIDGQENFSQWVKQSCISVTEEDVP